MIIEKPVAIRSPKIKYEIKTISSKRTFQTHKSDKRQIESIMPKLNLFAVKKTKITQ